MKCIMLMFFCLPVFLFAQNEPADVPAIEMHATSRESAIEEELEEILPMSYNGRRHDLNTISENEMNAVPGVDPVMSKNFFAYRAAMGGFLNIYELQCVPGWDANVCREMQVYFTVSDPLLRTALAKRAFEGEHSVSLQVSRVLEKESAYLEPDSSHASFRGSPLKLLLRYRYANPRKLQWGLLAEKDAGERLFNSASGFDHYSFHLLIRNWKKFSSIIVGDYKINFGQGLVQWQSLSFNKSAEILTSMRQGEEIRPNQSATESGFYRGVATSIEWARWRTTLFVSRMKRDGNLSDNGYGETQITSFISSGLHRTSAEISDRKSVVHTVAGASVHYRLRSGRVGFNLVSHSFDKAVKKTGEPYNFYSFEGNRLLNGSFDYAYSLRNIRVFGEVAFSTPGSMGMVQGVLVYLAPRVDLSIVYRNISPAYHSFESSAFTESADPVGEKGLYAGIQVKLSPAVHLSAYADHFMFPFYKFRLHGVGRGNSYLVQARLLPDKVSYCTIRFAMETKNTNSTGDLPIHAVGVTKRKNLRLQAGYPLPKGLSGVSRVEVAQVGEEGKIEHSYLLYSEVVFKAFHTLSGALRVQVTDIPSYSSRLYVYENSGASSGMVQMVYGRGVRLSARVKKKINRNFLAWMSVSRSLNSNNSGEGQENGKQASNQKTMFNLQIIYGF